jgi:hypothetical protein
MSVWLREQAEADLSAAKAATPGPWEFEGDDPTDDEVFDVPHCRPVAFTRGDARQVANGQHIARHDPLTEAARAESVLAVVREYEAAALIFDANRERPGGAGHSVFGLVRGLQRVMRLLALGYRYREGYRQEWAP